MSNIPEKHRAIAHAWVDGEEIEMLGSDQCWRPSSLFPGWYEDVRYRIKPKAKVKKWRWVFRSSYTDYLMITDCYLSETQAMASPEILQKIDSTMIEVDE